MEMTKLPDDDKAFLLRDHWSQVISRKTLCEKFNLNYPEEIERYRLEATLNLMGVCCQRKDFNSVWEVL